MHIFNANRWWTLPVYWSYSKEKSPYLLFLKTCNVVHSKARSVRESVFPHRHFTLKGGQEYGGVEETPFLNKLHRRKQPGIERNMTQRNHMRPQGRDVAICYVSAIKIRFQKFRSLQRFGRYPPAKIPAIFGKTWNPKALERLTKCRNDPELTQTDS